MLQKVQGKSRNKSEVPLGINFYLIYFYVRQLTGTLYRNGRASSPYQCHILLQLQPTVTSSDHRTPSELPTEQFCCTSMNQECKLILPLPGLYVFLYYFSFKQTMTTFERNQIFSFCQHPDCTNVFILLPLVLLIYFDFDFVWVLSSDFPLLLNRAFSFCYCCMFGPDLFTYTMVSDHCFPLALQIWFSCVKVKIRRADGRRTGKRCWNVLIEQCKGLFICTVLVHKLFIDPYIAH